MSKKLEDYLERAGNYFLETTREVIFRHEDESIQAERLNGMSTTVAALYDAKVKDDDIIRLIHKYYGVTESDAQEMLRIEKTIEHPCRELESYLIKEEGLSKEKAVEFIIDHGTVDMLRETRGMWKLTPKELLKKIESK